MLSNQAIIQIFFFLKKKKNKKQKTLRGFFFFSKNRLVLKPSQAEGEKRKSNYKWYLTISEERFVKGFEKELRIYARGKIALPRSGDALQ